MTERRAGGGDAEEGGAGGGAATSDGGEADALARLAAELQRFDPRALPLGPPPSPAAVRARLARYDFAAPRPLADVIGEAAELLRAWTAHANHPRHFGMFDQATDAASVAAGALAGRFNPNLAVWGAAPAAAEMERRALEALGERIGFRAGAGAHATFTTGGAESNLTALVAAMARACPTYADEGVAALGAGVTVYLSEEGHASVVKAACVAGVGRAAVARVACDAAARMNPQALAARIAADRAAGRTPLAVVATAGTTTAGAIDPLGEVAEVCAREGVWLHVDAAWGALAALSPRLAACLAGIERADSVAWDAHKGLGVAVGAGMFFCRDARALRAALSVDAPYMPRASGARAGVEHAFASTLQWSRRAAGLEVFLALASRGLRACGEAVERQCALADRMRGGLAARGFRLVNATPLPLVCATHPAIAAGAVRAKKVAARLLDEGAGWVTATRLRGEAVLRACVANARTEARDVDAVVDAMDRAVRRG